MAHGMSTTETSSGMNCVEDAYTYYVTVNVTDGDGDGIKSNIVKHVVIPHFVLYFKWTVIYIMIVTIQEYHLNMKPCGIVELMIKLMFIPKIIILQLQQVVTVPQHEIQFQSTLFATYFCHE